MAADAPSVILSRAADLIRDTAAAAGPNEWTFEAFAPAVWEGDARWIALMSPAVAEAQELILRNAAKDYDVQARIFTPEAMAQKLTERRFAGPMALARAVLGEKEDSDG